MLLFCFVAFNFNFDSFDGSLESSDFLWRYRFQNISPRTHWVLPHCWLSYERCKMMSLLYSVSTTDLGMFEVGSHQIQAVSAVQSQEPGDWRRISALNVKCFKCFVSSLFHPSFPKQRSSTKWWKHSPCRADRGRVPGGCSWSDPGLSWLGSGWRWCCAFWCSWGFEDVSRSHTVSLIVYTLKN